jgi:hypothetical protein
METLYERLKPELLANLNNNTVEFSDSVERVTKILTDNKFYSDLTMQEVESITSFCEVDMSYVSLFMFRFGFHLFFDLN